MGLKLPRFRRQMRLGAMSNTTAALSSKRDMAANATNVPSQGVFRLWSFEDSEPARRSSQPPQRPQQSTGSSTQQLQRQQSGPSRSNARQQPPRPSSSTVQQPQPQPASGPSTSQPRPTESQEQIRHSKEATRQSLTKSQKDKERQSKSRSVPAPVSADKSTAPLSVNNVKPSLEQKVETPPPQYTELPPPVKTKSKSIFSSKKSKKTAAPTRRNPNSPEFTPVKTTVPLNQQSKPKENKTVEKKRSSDNISHEAINRQIHLPPTATSPESVKIVDKSKQNVKSSSNQKNQKPSDTNSHGAINRQVNGPAVTKRSEAVTETNQTFKFVKIKKPSTETSQQEVKGPIIKSPKPTKKAPAKFKNKESDMRKREFPVKAPAAPASKAQADFEETGVLSFKIDKNVQKPSTRSFLYDAVQDADECDA